MMLASSMRARLLVVAAVMVTQGALRRRLSRRRVALVRSRPLPQR